MKEKVNELIPCNTNHLAVFDDGTSKEVIGWASKDGVEEIAGDVVQTSEISGLVVEKDQVVFADELNGFQEYKSEAECKEVMSV